MVLSPYWNVPSGIAVNDILPEAKKDPNYLIQKNIRVFKGWGTEAIEIDPMSVDWANESRKNLPYRFRQDPGPINALGGIKFMFPNKFNVYLHDTPSKELFGKPERTFSSGCIRIEKPMELAEYLLADQKNWNREKLQSVINQRKEQSVKLTRTIPVHLLYWTAWVDETGIVHFRKDVYGRDELLYEALKEPPPELE
jgi:murein L,D-transpeptidase YcbB/YkuD